VSYFKEKFMNKIKDFSQKRELEELLNEIKNYILEDVDYKDIIRDSEELLPTEFLWILKDIQKEKKDYVIVDVRSEKEYSANAIPYSINLPILNNIERHKVGLIYSKHSREKALSLAYYFAKEKEHQYISEIIKHSNGKKLIIYCWRGGVRSKYVSNLLKKNNIPVVRLQSGQKGFRKIVHEYMYNKTIPVISLSGITGCGKSEILEYIKKYYPDFPVIHLEECAGHASSVFGEIRYALKNETIKNQQQFETNIFMEILPYIGKDNNLPVFLSESESIKIGGLLIPPAVWISLREENHICLTCPMEKRIQRLAKDYFAHKSPDEPDEKESNKIKENVKEQLQYLSNKLSKEKIRQYKEWIDMNQYYTFLKDIMENYYDKIYKMPSKDPVLVIDNSSTDLTVKAIFEFWNSRIKGSNLFV
jgi:tRNA 2-selenouridine synthase